MKRLDQNKHRNLHSSPHTISNFIEPNESMAEQYTYNCIGLEEIYEIIKSFDIECDYFITAGIFF